MATTVDKTKTLVLTGGVINTSSGVTSAELAAEIATLESADTLHNQYSTRVYPDRATAVADIANLVPGQTTRIATIEGQSLCWRAPYQGADDPLSATSPFWGVVQRQNTAEIIAALPYSSLLRTYNETVVTNDATGTVYAATSPDQWQDMGLSLDSARIISFIPPTTNLGPVTVTFDGIETEYQVLTSTGAALVGGELRNTPYILQRWGANFRILNDMWAVLGSPKMPLIRGRANVGEFIDLLIGRAAYSDYEINWQSSATGEGTQGWTVISTTDGASISLPVSQEGRYIRARIRPAGDLGVWTVTNVIGPIGERLAGRLPGNVSASLEGNGANRIRVPLMHEMVARSHYLRDGVGAAPPMDLYRDYSLEVGTQWLGAVTASLPTTAATLLTTYNPPENVIHPCVVEFSNEFCGYRYVCAITAYPSGPSLEDPFVYGSNDRVNWTFLGSAPQPLDVKSATTGSYNSDTFLTHDPRTGELIVGWRRYEPRDDTSAEESNSDVILMYRSTRNGFAWSEPRQMLKQAADAQIMLAPTVIFDPETLTWHMWVIDRPVMHHWTAPALTGTWTLDTQTIDLSMFTTPHHHEIKWVGDKLACLMFDRGLGNLYFGVFQPGSWTQIDWNMTGVLNPRPASLYKASFVPVIGSGTVAFDLWWTSGAAGPEGGTEQTFGRALQYSRSNAAAVPIVPVNETVPSVNKEELSKLIRSSETATLPWAVYSEPTKGSPRRRLWPGANPIDGGLDDYAEFMVRRALRMQLMTSVYVNNERMAVAIGADRHATDLRVRDTDGKFPDDVVTDVFQRGLDKDEAVYVNGERVFFTVAGTDSEGRKKASELTVGEDLQVPSWVLSSWAGRMLGGAETLRSYPYPARLTWSQQMGRERHEAGETPLTEYIDGLLPNGQEYRLRVPTGYRDDRPVVVVIAAEGHGRWNAANDAGKNPNQGWAEAVDMGGIAWASCQFHNNNYGAPTVIEDVWQLYQAVTSQIAVSSIILAGNSMGGLTVQTILAHSPIGGIAGLIMTDPSCDLRQRYDAYRGPDIRAAYGIASDGSNYDEKTSGYDPILNSWTKWRGIPVRIHASSTDGVVPIALHAEKIAAKLSPHNDVELVNLGSGGHQSSNRFHPEDLVNFIEKCTSGSSVYGV